MEEKAVKQKQTKVQKKGYRQSEKGGKEKSQGPAPIARVLGSGKKISRRCSKFTTSFMLTTQTSLQGLTTLAFAMCMVPPLPWLSTEQHMSQGPEAEPEPQWVQWVPRPVSLSSVGMSEPVSLLNMPLGG
ncbi:hypothetical protein DL89DRAFT_255534 [Linderina pennispora]|uniref:Uncharacterized protein n=1 Tax=Linderina pennispora TaxID=61395 RepID=A0A1Y1WE63_9FUNG|nr:uncharacterized protein DL89DRAFT_255534 [Linderina pennispora]ORX71803.1 hypothetical protein DL89DRAFT_255534 [Linderina pennispora]